MGNREDDYLLVTVLIITIILINEMFYLISLICMLSKNISEFKISANH